MIISAETLQAIPEFSEMDSETITRQLRGIEDLIRAYTNNNFQQRGVRFYAAVASDGTIQGYDRHISVGDTLQVSESINDGLYTVASVNPDAGTIAVNESIFEEPIDLFTKVVYPASISEGVINLMRWQLQSKDKVGIQSETISRHTVTYFTQDSANQLMGYPVALLGFLKLYTKARF